MTYRAWWDARWLLFEERFGVLIRAHQREERRIEDQRMADYLRSVATLKRAQGSSDGDR